MRLSKIIETTSDWPLLPIILTHISKHKSVRVLGVLIYLLWFLPAVIAWGLIAGVLAIPAMIQDA